MKFHARSVLVVLIGTLAFAARPVRSESPPAGRSRVHDRRLGEESEIAQRREWFLSTRRQGATADGDLWRLRRAAVEETRTALAQQRAHRALFGVGQDNGWFARGPAPATFGGWAFGNISGRVQALAADWNSGTLYVGAASGGVWKSVNDGLTWVSLFDRAGTTAVGAISIDPSDPAVIWVGTGDNITGCEGYFGIGLLRSADGGNTWEPRNGSGVNSLDNLSSFASVLVDPRDVEHIVTGGRYRGCGSGSSTAGGIYTTIDGGLSWIPRLANVEIHEIVQNPVVLDTYWAATRDGVYKSIDNAQTWTLQTAAGLPNTDVGRVEIAIAPSAPDTVYALFASGPAFWRTTDGGTSWTQMSTGTNACDGQCSYNMTLQVHRTDPNTVYRGTVRVYKTQNGGTTWTNLTNTWGSSQQVHQDTHALLMHPTQVGTFWVAGDGGVWKSIDGGATFSNANGNLNITQFYAIGVDAQDPERICGGAQDNSSLARDGGDVWGRQAVTGDGFVCHIDPLDPNYAYITSYPSGGLPSISRSSNGLFGDFTDISDAANGIVFGDRSNWVTPYLLDPLQPNVLYLGTHRVYKSIDHGSNWTQVGPADLTNGTSSLLTLEIQRTAPGVLYSGSVSGRVWRSADAGVQWSDITAGLPLRTINDLAADPANPSRAFAALGGFNAGHVWEWNADTGWAERSTGLPNVPANTVLMLSSSDLFVGTDTGIFRSLDGGQSFAPWMEGLPEGLVVTDLDYNPSQNVLTAGTYGRGAWQAIAGPVQPFVVLDSIAQPLVELDGDADTAIEPGESWSLRPILRNAGGEAALNLTARLTSSTPGVTILAPESVTYGDVPAGATAQSPTAYRFAVNPSFDCGAPVVFDLDTIATSNAPGTYPDLDAILVTDVEGEAAEPVETNLVNEDVDPLPPSGWNHESVDAALPVCPSFVELDQWQVASKDPAHQDSFHCGAGPGATYQRGNYAWLYHAGKESAGGSGLVLPATAVAVTLTVEHWFDTAVGEDGGQVVIDAVDDGDDDYVQLIPSGGYSGGAIGIGNCNPLTGQSAFQGSSGGWITSTFDLTPFKGGTVWIAFVFGSDRGAATGEGWYVDRVKVDTLEPAPPQCDVSPWPGEVPTAWFSLLDPSTIEADWTESCNLASFPAQTYSIQVGDLDALRTSGNYNHAPIDDRCDRTAPAAFTTGASNAYYLIVPAGDGREGGAGSNSTGLARPQVSNVCGARRVGCSAGLLPGL